MAGVQFRSPVGVGAIGGIPENVGGDEPAEAYAEVLLRHIKAGVGYVYVTGTFVTEATIKKLRERARFEERHFVKPGGVGARSLKIGTTDASYGREVLYTLAAPFRITPEWANREAAVRETLMKILKKKKPEDVRIIANTIGFGDLPDTYVDGARRWEELGADLIELNLSCPFPPGMRGAVDDFFQKRFPARFQGMLIGDNLDLVEEITGEVVKAVKIPVGVKLSPETGFPRIVEFARKVRDAGAKFIQVVNSGVGIAPPDIYNRGKPLWPFADGNSFCMVSGSWLRIPCYRDVAAIARFVPGLDIAAAGGLMMPEHCVEVMMLGARNVQLCTGVLEQGRSLIRRSTDFIKKFMVEQGYKSVEEFIGLGQQYIKYQEDVDLMVGKVVSEPDEEKCSKCGQCVDNMCSAPYFEHGKIKIRTEKCSGCGLCIVACPSGALKLVLRDQANPS
jgi:dihydropyrimidine dehydrogenase (NAD+) subunit PreA